MPSIALAVFAEYPQAVAYGLVEAGARHRDPVRKDFALLFGRIQFRQEEGGRDPADVDDGDAELLLPAHPAQGPGFFVLPGDEVGVSKVDAGIHVGTIKGCGPLQGFDGPVGIAEARVPNAEPVEILLGIGPCRGGQGRQAHRIDGALAALGRRGDGIPHVPALHGGKYGRETQLAEPDAPENRGEIVGGREPHLRSGLDEQVERGEFLLIADQIRKDRERGAADSEGVVARRVGAEGLQRSVLSRRLFGSCGIRSGSCL